MDGAVYGAMKWTSGSPSATCNRINTSNRLTRHEAFGDTYDDDEPDLRSLQNVCRLHQSFYRALWGTFTHKMVGAPRSRRRSRWYDLRRSVYLGDDCVKKKKKRTDEHWLGGGEVGSAVTIASTSAASAAASTAGPSTPKPGPSATIRSSDDEDSDVGSQGFSTVTRGST